MQYCPYSKYQGTNKTASWSGFWRGMKSKKQSRPYKAGAADFRGWWLLLGCIKHLLHDRCVVA